MNETDIKTKLDQLASYRAAVDVLQLQKQVQKQALIETILTPEIKAKLADIDAEFAGKAQDANEKAATLEAEVKQAVIALGTTVKGTFIQAVWAKGKTSWDTSGMIGYAVGYAVAHPELNVFKKVGEPSVRLVSVK